MNTTNAAPRRDALSLRVSPQLKNKLASRAAERHRSVMAEAEILLERGIALEEINSSSLMHLLRNMLLGFGGGGHVAAIRTGHREWTPDEWTKDPGCYENALLAMVRTLWKLHPAPSAEAAEKWVDELRGWLVVDTVKGISGPEAARIYPLEGDAP